MRNNVGSGPSAKATVSTPADALATEQEPILILANEEVIIEQANLFDEPIILYNTSKYIRGTSLHIKKKLLFVSDSEGNIIKTSLDKNLNSDTNYILTAQDSGFMPLDLSVDWLNDQLYILSEIKIQFQTMWQLARCDFNGHGLTIAVAGLRSKPYNMEIDPYNGYLFWAIRENYGAGLYRLDISDISNGIKHEIRPELILQNPNLGAFTVDPTNFRLFVSNEKQKTVLTVSLDGKEETDIRSNVIASKFRRVVSLASANSKFYWTNGDDVFWEEYHNRNYFHNAYPFLKSKSYKKVMINLPSCQPTPIPVNPPSNVQAIFGKNFAKTSWQPPHLLGIQGKGAWQNWSYEIAIKQVLSSDIISHRTINVTSCKILELKEDTAYIIKVAAYTDSGKGPWSSEFQGITLPSSKNPTVFWSGSRGLLKSDAAGENVETMIDKSTMKNFFYVDMTWYQDQIYLVTNESRIYWYNMITHHHGQLIDVDSVGGIAVDWIGKKLYWSNPKQQMIIRGNFNGTQQEPLPIFTLAKELNIDSVKAYLYWSTGYAVQCAHLNGEDAIEYHPVQLFSGQQVMGLTLDVDRKYLYWIVRGSEGSNLFRAPMAGYSDSKIQVEKISSLQKSNMQGLLCYFQRRLLWLQDDKNAAISDMQGKNIATIGGETMSDLKLVYVVDSSLRVAPGLPSEEIVVIPEKVDKHSVQVIGSVNSFNVTWKPIQNVNYGEVFYEVSIDSLPRNDSVIITKETSIKYRHQVTPFTKLQVTIRAFTYWGSSSQVQAKVYSPPSKPSTPRNLRVYVTHQHDADKADDITITVRWGAPTFPNGVIKGYRVQCWFTDDSGRNEDVCQNITKSTKQLQIDLKGVNKNILYNFKVQAYSEIGGGDFSETASINSSSEFPLPRLLIASKDSIFIHDVDSNNNENLLHSINTPVKIGYLIRESKLFWINELYELVMYNIKTNNKTKLIDLQNEAISLTVDWLERSLYYSQKDDFSEGSTIFKIDLNYVDRGIVKPIKICSRASIINSIEVSPYTKKLYWVEDLKLWSCNTDGSESALFFDNYNIRKQSLKDCNCPKKINIKETYTLDHSTQTKPLLIFIDSDTQNILSTDKDGCFCNIVTNSTISAIEHIKSDFGLLYWTNQRLLYAFRRNDTNLVTKDITVQDVVIYGRHVQPFPSKKCLIAKQAQNITLKLKHKGANSLTFDMPEYKVSEFCRTISLATIEYQIYYIQQTDNMVLFNYTNYNVSRTLEKHSTLSHLKPFTNYLVSVAISNYYTNDEEVLIGPSMIFQTAVGAPSPPQNVAATVLNPTMVKVTWSPPLEFNGATVHYEIYWKTERTLSGVRQNERPVVEEQLLPNSTECLTTTLTKLSPNETYKIWVRAYSETNETSSDSETLQIKTYPEPRELILVNKTAYNLQLSWKVLPYIERYSVQCSPFAFNEWENVTLEEETDTEIVIAIDNLEPKTQYKFRFLLFYKNFTEEYIWPQDLRFVYETLGDKPSPPGIPKIQYVKPDVYKVWWEASKENGADIKLYKLEGLQLPNYRTKRSANRTAFFYTAPSIEEEERQWVPFYNGSERSWIINGLSEKFRYEFRASALNAYGWSDPSDSSPAFDLNEAAKMAEKQSPLTLIAIATFVPVTVFLFILSCIVCKKYSKPKKLPLVSIPRAPDVELATLRELPRRGIHNTNVLYLSTQPNNEDLTMLPHIRRDQITLMKFLGSGAFGEVFEGKAKGILVETAETKVAVKTLRKGASDQEKTEFLQEAQLMSNFKHEHILQLLGVCLDNDPQFIIMELMEGGDLLTYLRCSRNQSTNTSSLTLIELLKMCVDVAKGCRYLEEMHFVHRDLACRNCLVSSKETEQRIVKIGDFGLARDIYKNDYYRKEGEGLLPVRWMAPESLVDGVFTSQSDVWAFGVLLWEIMTLGQQPYPARNNLEVLHYVRTGGRLGKPMDCPKPLHDLMLKCWEFEADSRPTFNYCLDILENLHIQICRSSSANAHDGQYISTVQDCDLDDDENKEKTPFLSSDTTSTTIPNYLELLYVQENPNDGYEIPNEIVQTEENSSSLVSKKNETRLNGSVKN